MAETICSNCGGHTHHFLGEVLEENGIPRGVKGCYVRLSKSKLGWEKGCAYDKAPQRKLLYIEAVLLKET